MVNVGKGNVEFVNHGQSAFLGQIVKQDAFGALSDSVSPENAVQVRIVDP